MDVVIIIQSHYPSGAINATARSVTFNFLHLHAAIIQHVSQAVLKQFCSFAALELRKPK